MSCFVAKCLHAFRICSELAVPKTFDKIPHSIANLNFGNLNHASCQLSLTGLKSDTLATMEHLSPKTEQHFESFTVSF